VTAQDASQDHACPDRGDKKNDIVWKWYHDLQSAADVVLASRELPDAADVDKLMTQLNTLIDAGNTVVVVEHDTRVVTASDWVIDMGPGAADHGGRIVARGNGAPSRTTAPVLDSKLRRCAARGRAEPGALLAA
jgi:hypothetical protein